VALPPPDPGSTALVTGASAGIGSAIARLLAERGHGVLLVARREERLRKLAEALRARHGIHVDAIGADLADPDARDRLASQLAQSGLTVEILVNNAGFGGIGTFVDLGRERQVEMLRVNVEAVIDLAARYLPGMVERGRGAVINIASTAAFQPMPRNATYAATKSFVLSWGEAIHHELKGSGVSVTTVCPGPVRTEFAEAAGIGGAEERTPGVIWMEAEDVARHAVEAAEQGKRAVVPGALNRATSLAGQLSPRRFALPIADRIWRRGTS
jgi:short-subunit dehydrogenase